MSDAVRTMPSGTPIRVLVVDDSAFMRKAISRMLEEASGIEVVATGNNGLQAVELAKKYKPDVMTLDIEMPQMDGLTALGHIKRACNTRVIMISSLTTEGSHVTLRALRRGADDFITKDCSQVSLNIVSIEKDLLSKIRALGHAARTQPAKAKVAEPVDSGPDHVNLSGRRFRLIAVGSSTGGPPALEKLLIELPADLTCPIVVAQHMPALFTKSMAERLDERCKMHVKQAEDGETANAGTIYIAEGGKHVRIRRGAIGRFALEVCAKPTDAPYHPSVDELYRSAAELLGNQVLGVMLTGMGQDGLEGGRVLHQKGGPIIAQDHASSVVYGMPKAVTEAGLVCANMPPEKINDTIRTWHTSVRGNIAGTRQSA